MSQAKPKIAPDGASGQIVFEVIDLDSHPDGLLFQLCAHLARLRGHVEALEQAILAIPAQTDSGASMKMLAVDRSGTCLN